MNLYKGIRIVIFYIIIIYHILYIFNIKTYSVEEGKFLYRVEVKHSILEQLHYESYIEYIENHYQSLDIEIEDILLFQFVKPKGFNNQKLSLRYGVIIEDTINYGTLYINIESIFAFLYSRTGSITSSTIIFGLMTGVHLVKIKIKKR
jgi:hypothetical protein